MSSVKRLITNTYSMFIAQGLQPFLSILLVVVIGRTLGKEIYGQYIIIFQIYSIFQITCSLGLKTLLTREVAKDKSNSNRYLVNGVLLGIPAALINIIIAVVAVFLLNYESNVAIGAYIITIAFIAAGLSDILSGILTGFEEVKKIAHAWIVFLVLKTLFSVVALLTGFGLYALIIIHIVTKFIHSILIYFYIYKITGKPRLEIDFPLWHQLIKMGWSLALLAIMVSLFWRVDAIMLSKMVSDEMVGNYGAAYRIFHFMLMTVRSFSMAFFPMISSMAVNRPKDFRKACRKAIRYLTILVVPLAVISTFLAAPIMNLLWGEKFDIPIVAQVLQVMIWSLVPFGISEVFGSALIASGKQVTYFTIKTVVLILKMILNYYLTIKFGVVGPAISTIIALVLLLMMQFPFIVPGLLRFQIKSVLVPFIKLLGAIGLTSLALYAVHSYHFVLGMLLGGLVYVGALVLLKMVTNKDMVYFRKLRKGKSKRQTVVTE